MSLRDTFQGKSVFLTGHTGFKGSWLSLWLARLGARVHGFSLPPPSEPSNFALSGVEELLAGHTLGDIRDAALLAGSLRAAQPDVIFHLAAQPIVRESYECPRETFEANVMGTVNLLEAVRAWGHPCVVVVITSDKCYRNDEQVWGYREIDPMGGHDPYSASKGAAELVVSAYRDSFFPPDRLGSHGVHLASARAGNVIGGGDWARDRIVTDIVRHLLGHEPIPVRNPGAVRPWQHVLEPLSGYLALAESMVREPDAAWCSGWNFGPRIGEQGTVRDLVDEFVALWGSGAWQDVGRPDQPHEARLLRLSIDKATTELGWGPRWGMRETLERTVRWYRRVLLEGGEARAACHDDIEAYERG